MVSGIAWSALTRFNDLVYRVFVWVCGLAIVAVVVSVSYQVVSRYFLFGGTPWSEEIAVYSFIWAVMLGNAIGVRDHSHMVADILPPNMGWFWDRFIESLTHATHLVIGILFLWWGWRYADMGWFRYSDILGFPMFYMFVAAPVTAVAMITFLTERFIKCWWGERL